MPIWCVAQEEAQLSLLAMNTKQRMLSEEFGSTSKSRNMQHGNTDANVSDKKLQLQECLVMTQSQIELATFVRRSHILDSGAAKKQITTWE